MAIRIPTSNQSKIFLGSQEIGAVYVGANKVWPDAPVIDPDAFIMRISVTAGQTVTIPFRRNSVGYNGTINWKDGSITKVTAYNIGVTHTYMIAGDYDIEFLGTFAYFYFYSATTPIKNIVKKIKQWGNISMTSTDQAFYGCINLDEIGGDGIISALGVNCFVGCASLTSITIPSTVTIINSGCFQGCTSLTSITIPSNITTLGLACFQNSGLLSITIPSTVVNIGSSIFSYCLSLTSVTILTSYISEYSFYYCSNLVSVTVSSSVSSIGGYSFYGCSNQSLVLIFNNSTPPTLTPTAFTGLSLSARIEVPAASVNAYKTAAYWSTYANQIYAQS